MDNVVESPQKEAGKSSNTLKKFILGLLALAFITIIFLAAAIYLAFGYIRASIETASYTIPFLAGAPVKNQIAFTGNDNNLWLVEPDGDNLHRITEDGRGYRFPTWSPDGRRLAFIGPGITNRTALYMSPTSTSDPVMVYHQPGSSPFYLYWAPDSHSITFLTQDRAGMSMRQVDTIAPDESRLLGEGAPFYWVWSPQSDKLLMHVGGSRSVSENAHISILDNQTDAQRVQLDLAPGRFQAPVWSADGSYFYYSAANSDGGDSIFKTNAATLEQSTVTHVKGFAHMVLSSNGGHLAYLQLERSIPAPFGRAYLVDTEGNNQRLLTEDPVASMYWSPDGKKLALLSFKGASDGSTAQKIQGLAAPLAQAFQLRWWIYDMETEAIEPLVSFSPTQAFLQTIPYFDQYHLSLTFWSPDSRYFVVTKGKANEREGSVWVVDTTGKDDPQKVGDGTLAVWSWQ